MTFMPIKPNMVSRHPSHIVKPKAKRLNKAVYFSKYTMDEFGSLLKSEKDYSAVQNAIKTNRGGVLPTNWEDALDVKSIMEMMRATRLYN